jgi:hypothetical protein
MRIANSIIDRSYIKCEISCQRNFFHSDSAFDYVINFAMRVERYIMRKKKIDTTDDVGEYQKG